MFSSLDVDIRPGQGLGSFHLGTSLYTVLNSLRAKKHIFPQVEVKFDPDEAVTTVIIVFIRPHISLVFSGIHQRLSSISVGKLRDPHPPITLRYKDAVLSSTDEVLRQVGVSKAFGPTYPGELRYPGISFSFDEDGVGGTWSGDKQQEVKRVLVTQTGEQDALDEVEECSAMDGDVSQAVVKVHDGVTLHFYPESSSTPVHIRIGETTAQDLVIDLGPPVVHYKDDDRPALWDQSRRPQSASSEEQLSAPQTSDYFYNYFNLGIDFLLSGDTHIVRKIILHTNIPGTAMFQRYKRCPWEIESEPEDDEDDSPPSIKFYEKVEQISNFLGAREPPPAMTLDRTDEDEGVTLPSPITRLYPYDGIILEATETSFVTCVILF